MKAGLALDISFIVIVSFWITAYTQMCYRVHRPISRFNRRQGYCNYPIGGLRREMGVYISSMNSCCRRPRAHGWGVPYSCMSCANIRGTPGPWTQWSTCSQSCGLGRQTRRRTCNTAVCAGMRGRNAFESRKCIWQPCCPVDGSWSHWSKSTGCSVTCGTGVEFRIRSCNSPAPLCGGARCKGIHRQYKDCEGGTCAQWGTWAEQGPCSATCGNGTILRLRECHRTAADFCPGKPEDFVPCFEAPCKVAGDWCEWEEWSPCTTTCGGERGTRKRIRLCTCPTPDEDALPCNGPGEEIAECRSETPCPVNGDWGDWSSWSFCSGIQCVTSKGIQVRSRGCDNPLPAYGGKTCSGEDFENRNCLNMDKCFVEGVYGVWSEWQPCSHTCGRCATKERTRECTLPFANATYWDVDVVMGTPKLICLPSLSRQTVACSLPDCVVKDESCSSNDEAYNYFENRRHSTSPVKITGANLNLAGSRANGLGSFKSTTENTKPYALQHYLSQAETTMLSELSTHSSVTSTADNSQIATDAVLPLATTRLSLTPVGTTSVAKDLGSSIITSSLTFPKTTTEDQTSVPITATSTTPAITEIKQDLLKRTTMAAKVTFAKLTPEADSEMPDVTTNTSKILDVTMGGNLTTNHKTELKISTAMPISATTDKVEVIYSRNVTQTEVTNNLLTTTFTNKTSVHVDTALKSPVSKFTVTDSSSFSQRSKFERVATTAGNAFHTTTMGIVESTPSWSKTDSLTSVAAVTDTSNEGNQHTYASKMDTTVLTTLKPLSVTPFATEKLFSEDPEWKTTSVIPSATTKNPFAEFATTSVKRATNITAKPIQKNSVDIYKTKSTTIQLFPNGKTEILEGSLAYNYPNFLTTTKQRTNSGINDEIYLQEGEATHPIPSTDSSISPSVTFSENIRTLSPEKNFFLETSNQNVNTSPRGTQDNLDQFDPTLVESTVPLQTKQTSLTTKNVLQSKTNTKERNGKIDHSKQKTQSAAKKLLQQPKESYKSPKAKLQSERDFTEHLADRVYVTRVSVTTYAVPRFQIREKYLQRLTTLSATSLSDELAYFLQNNEKSESILGNIISQNSQFILNTNFSNVPLMKDIILPTRDFSNQPFQETCKSNFEIQESVSAATLLAATLPTNKKEDTTISNDNVLEESSGFFSADVDQNFLKKLSDSKLAINEISDDAFAQSNEMRLEELLPMKSSTPLPDVKTFTNKEFVDASKTVSKPKSIEIVGETIIAQGVVNKTNAKLSDNKDEVDISKLFSNVRQLPINSDATPEMLETEMDEKDLSELIKTIALSDVEMSGDVTDDDKSDTLHYEYEDNLGDGEELDYDEDKQGQEPRQDENVKENLLGDVNSVDRQDATENCMGLPEAFMTPRLKKCCQALEINITLYNTEDKFYEDCLSLQFEHLYGVNDEVDLDEIAPRSFGRHRCMCVKKPKLLESVCCYKSYCHQWPHTFFRTLCRECRPFCKPCFRSLLSG
ncbi:uncharacterized protein LOC143450093 [Clavelina lepadiformis]|uniref:uncharacterized protein LOC143450093 n=1 Tax=Clavelina lepadiformis TaxID=159417 RepID=UPI004042AE2F